MEHLTRILPLLPGFIVGLTVHEYCHAWAANRLGDTTARDRGRMTLNPLAHLDLFGTLALLVVGFGWAKGVPIDSTRFRSPRGDMALVALVGPFSNLCIALCVALGFRVLAVVGGVSLLSSSPFLVQVIVSAAAINVILAIFNLIPLPPLDGSKILAAALPSSWSRVYERAERFGPLLLIGLFVVADYAGLSVFDRVVWPVANVVLRLLLGVPLS